MKLFLKRKIVCSFELIYNHGLVFGITSLSVFTEDTFLAGLAESLVLKNAFVFIRIYVLVFLQMGHVNLRKM